MLGLGVGGCGPDTGFSFSGLQELNQMRSIMK